MNHRDTCPFSNIDTFAQPIISYIRKKLKIKYKNGKPGRAFHAKTIGVVKGKLQIASELEEENKIGIFKNRSTYDVYIRFTNGSSDVKFSDGKKTARGMAIKILNVESSEFLDPDPEGKTQDIILFTSPIFTPSQAEDQHDGVKTVLGKIFEVVPAALNIFSKYPRSAVQFIKLANIHSPNILEETYYSGTPYCYGLKKAIKWQALPLKTITSIMPPTPSDNFLRDRLISDLSPESKHTVGFDLFVQFQTNQDSEPIEDCTVIWKSKPIKVGTIYIPQQKVDSEEMDQLDKRLTYSPGHSIIEHAPLGVVNLIRRKVYQVLSRERQEHL